MDRYERFEETAGMFSSFSFFNPHFYSKARDTYTDAIVVLKICSPDFSGDEEGVPHRVMREVSILRDLQHEHVVRLQNFVRYDAELFFSCMVFEFFDKDLKTYMQDAGDLNPKIVKSFLHQICCGITFCHSHGIMHRFVEPSHCAISPEGTIKIFNFELARSGIIDPDRELTVCGIVSLWYRAPELLLGAKIYSYAIDMFAVGVSFAEMLHSRRLALFPGMVQIDQLYRIFRQLGTPNEDVWQGVTSMPDWNDAFPKWHKTPFHQDILENIDATGIDLLEKLLEYNPHSRITARDALNHPYFDDVERINQ